MNESNMQKLRSQIKESFFNPVLHFLPLFLYLILEDIFSRQIAWLIALPVSLMLLVYIYFVYKKLFDWYVGSTLIFVSVVTVIGILSLFPVSSSINHIESEIVVLGLFALSLVFRKKIELAIHNASTKKISMVNNLNELFRMIWILGAIIFFYVHVYVLLLIYDVRGFYQIVTFLNNLYVGAIIFVFIYELIRVSIIRIGLLKEEWWPIVSEQGKVIGHIQHALSIEDDRKYMHPVIRVWVVENNRILLQKTKSDMLINPGLWDVAITNHVRMGESVSQCIARTAKERYGLDEFKTIMLSNYTLETECEYQYAFLFVSCNLPEIGLNTKYMDHFKWWTLGQIEDNLSVGIFSENLMLELDIIKRSGLLDSSGLCECDCRLKTEIDSLTKIK